MWGPGVVGLGGRVVKLRIKSWDLWLKSGTVVRTQDVGFGYWGPVPWGRD